MVGEQFPGKYYLLVKYIAYLYNDAVMATTNFNNHIQFTPNNINLFFLCMSISNVLLCFATSGICFNEMMVL